MFRFFTLLIPCCLLAPLGAQDLQFSGGFRAGLNFNALSGPVETSANEMTEYEEARRTTGFHVGATFALAFTDLVGVKADLMYSQKGGEFLYGSEENPIPSYFYLYEDNDDVEGEIIFGRLNGEVDVINSYIDIPLTAYYRLGPIEIEGGVSAGFLVSSRVSGGLTYTPDAPIPGVGGDVIFNVDGNYFRDDRGFEGVEEFSDNQLQSGNFLPRVISAYYNSDREDNLYRRFNFTLVAGLAFNLNNGLYVGARYHHGLTDVTNGENDLRVSNENRTGERVFNTDDEDFTRSIQASVGFRF